MPWTEITRPHYVREGLRYASDTADAEWALIEPWMPPPKRLGRQRKTKLCSIVDALLYILATGCQWRMLPKDFPPRSTVQGYFYRWREDGTLWRINHALVMAAREMDNREASPSAGIIGSQSVKTTEMGGPKGYDAGKKINGRKRHALADTDGRALLVEPHTADIQDRDGGGAVLQISRSLFPFIEKVWADGGYNHERVTQATSIKVGIVNKITGQTGFIVLPRRWVVERFFAWINRNRRLAKDVEATLKSAAAFLYAAAAMLMIRRLARSA